MKTKRVFLIIIIALFIGANTPVVASANSAVPLAALIQDPECGTYTDTQGGPGDFGNYSTDWVEVFVSVIITSYNGWQIVQAKWLDFNEVTVASHSFPPGTTSEVIPYPAGGASYLSVTLKKNCACSPTGRYVYTLLGNYPCNLLTKDNSIPARFLDPEYTGPLCNLPALDHIWNGDWVKNEELDCGGYFVGGNHYDTSLGILP